MKNLRIAERIFNTPLMIAEPKWNGILHIIGPRFELDLSGIPTAEAREVTDAERRRAGYVVQNGMGIVGIHGPLMHRLFASDYPSGGPTTYAEIRQSFDTALEDDAVQQIVLDIDSPGGEVNGVFDLAEHIYQSRGRKPITAVVDESAFSAAYLLASAAGRVVVPRTGGVGSVGVIATHVDQSTWNENAGLKVTHVFAGAQKADFSPHRPLTDSALTRLQEMVDDTYRLFVDTVARNRGLSAEAVRKTEAGIYVGKKAVAVGLADEVAAVDKTLARLAKTKGGTIMTARADQGQAAAVEATPETQNSMEGQGAAATTPAAATPAAATPPAPEAKPVAAAQSSIDLDAIRAEATTAERQRILAIYGQCRGSQALPMFEGLVKDGASEEQSGRRIQDALAMRDDAAGIVSRHGGVAGEAKPQINTAEYFEHRQRAVGK